MSHNIFSIDTNNDICDVVGCSVYWTEEIWVAAGTYGNIKLFLCPNCISKFSNVCEQGILVPDDNSDEFQCQ